MPSREKEKQNNLVSNGSGTDRSGQSSGSTRSSRSSQKPEIKKAKKQFEKTERAKMVAELMSFSMYGAGGFSSLLAQLVHTFRTISASTGLGYIWNTIDSMVFFLDAASRVAFARQQKEKGHVQSPNKSRTRQAFGVINGLIGGSVFATTVGAIVNMTLFGPLMAWAYAGAMVYGACRSLFQFGKSIHLARPKMLLKDIEGSLNRLKVALFDAITFDVNNSDLLAGEINERKNTLQAEKPRLHERLETFKANQKKGIETSNDELVSLTNDLREWTKNNAILYQLKNYRRLLLQKQALKAGIENSKQAPRLYQIMMQARREKIGLESVNFLTQTIWALGFSFMSTIVLMPVGLICIGVGSFIKLCVSFGRWASRSFNRFMVHQAQDVLADELLDEKNTEDLRGVFKSMLEAANVQGIEKLSKAELYGTILVLCKQKIIHKMGKDNYFNLSVEDQNRLQRRMMVELYYEHQTKKALGNDYDALTKEEQRAERYRHTMQSYYQTTVAQKTSPMREFFRWLGQLGKPDHNSPRVLSQAKPLRFAKRFGRVFAGGLIALLGFVLFPIVAIVLAVKHRKQCRLARGVVSSRKQQSYEQLSVDDHEIDLRERSNGTVLPVSSVSPLASPVAQFPAAQNVDNEEAPTVAAKSINNQRLES